jgi:hypothetical protein
LEVTCCRRRPALGLRAELMTLMVAEVVAARYHRAQRDGTGDAVLADVAGRILADEDRHVPLHCQRLGDGFAGTPGPARAAGGLGWWPSTRAEAVLHPKAIYSIRLTRLHDVLPKILGEH